MRIASTMPRGIWLGWLLLGAGVAPLSCTTVAAEPAATVSPTDPDRFTRIPDWTGTFTTGAESSGTRTDSLTTVTWAGSISVDARFKLAPYKDPRNSETTLRGRGEAHVRVSGKRRTAYKHETVDTIVVGDYVDTFTAEVSNFDKPNGTYQLAVIRDLRDLQPHKEKAYQRTTITTNSYGSRKVVDMVPGHSWANDAGAGFGRPTPLPKSGFLIKGTITSHNDDLFSADGSRWVTNWTIEPASREYDEPLEAVAGGPYVIERGQTVHLDGWKSTGRIRSFKWTFGSAASAGTEANIPFTAGCSKEGRRVTATLLAPIKATLTVSDGTREDSDSVVVQVKARDFKTPFRHRDKEKLHPNSIAPRFVKNRNIAYVGGENVCALCPYGPQESIHVLHPEPVADSWDKIGYELTQVKDPGGPFDGVWFVDSYLGRVEREILMNKYILPGGPPPVSTAQPFYETNKAMGHDVEAYLAAVRKHERLHSTYMQESLEFHEPGMKIEPLAAKDRATIKAGADQHLRTISRLLTEHSDDPLPSIGFKQEMAFPNDATDEYVPVEMEL